MRSAKSKRSKIEGKSLPLNLVLAVSNLLAFYFLVYEFQSGGFLEFKFLINAAIFGFSIFGLFVFRGFLLYAYLAKFFVGFALLVSGFSILNDPKGYAAVLNFYFTDGNLNLWIHHALGWSGLSFDSWLPKVQWMALFLGLAQIIFGISILFNLLYRVLIWLALPLLFFSAIISWQNFSCQNKIAVTQSKNQISREKKQSLITFEEVVSQQQKCAQTSQLEDLGGPILLDYFGASKGMMPLGFVLLFLAVILGLTAFIDTDHTSFEQSLYAVITWLSLLAVAIVTYWFWLAFFSLISFYLVLGTKRLGAFFENQFTRMLLVSGCLFGIGFYALQFEPYTDFRPYTQGVNLSKNEQIARPFPEWIATFEKSGSQKVFHFLPEELKLSNVLFDEQFDFEGLRLFQPTLAQIEAFAGFNPLLSLLSQTDLDVYSNKQASFLEKIKADYVQLRSLKDSVDLGFLRKSTIPKELKLKEQYEIHRFEESNENLTNIPVLSYLSSEKLAFVWILCKPDKMKTSDWEKLKRTESELQLKQSFTAGICSSRSRKYEVEFRQIIPLIFYLNQHEINRIFRSKYGLLVIKRGVVVGKYSGSRMPSAETLIKKHL